MRSLDKVGYTEFDRTIETYSWIASAVPYPRFVTSSSSLLLQSAASDSRTAHSLI